MMNVDDFQKNNYDVIHACFIGKTKLVQAVCKAAACTLFSVTNSDLLSRWFGESNEQSGKNKVSA
jgi:hypothetical protein